LDKNGAFDFSNELIDTVTRFLIEYQEASGPFRNDLEKGLVISYILGTMRCDLEMIWDCLGENEVFGSLHPRAVFDNCADGEDAASQQMRAHVKERICQFNWFSKPSDELLSGD